MAEHQKYTSEDKRFKSECMGIMLDLQTKACWKSNTTNAKIMAFAPSLALDPTFGIHPLKTLDTDQPCHLLKPN